MGEHAGGATWTPAIDVFDEKDAIVLHAELPGLTAEDIDIEVDDNVLTLKGERRFEQQVEEGRYYRIERAYGSFSRSLTLPQGVKADEITADVDAGVLRVRVPKADEVRPRKIAVGAVSAA
jgi:HSP20 family protein